VRLERVSEANPISSPADYIFRVAINVAKDRRRSESQTLSLAEIEAICDVPDDQPGPAAILESRLELQAFKEALAEMSERRQTVFAAAHIERVPHAVIAQRLNINVRTVDFDLQHAMEHLSRRLGRQAIRRFGPRARKAKI
jgi:RNA polymerase sigma-70 factor, ECF subfamily